MSKWQTASNKKYMSFTLNIHRNTADSLFFHSDNYEVVKLMLPFIICLLIV